VSLPGWQRVQLAACAGVIAYMLAYVATDYAALPHLYYRPHQRDWQLAGRLSGLPAGYVGLWLWATLAGLAAGGLTHVGLRWRRAPVSDRALALWLAWTVTAVVLALAYYTWHNWP
jgi:hypothetical protein